MTVVPDPRPIVTTEDGAARVAGAACAGCGYVSALARPRCPRCRSPLAPAPFGPAGTVWASTTVRVPIPGREPPFTLAYVDLDGGPRVLAHVAGHDEAPVPVGAAVRLCGRTADGDLEVEVVGS